MTEPARPLSQKEQLHAARARRARSEWGRSLAWWLWLLLWVLGAGWLLHRLTTAWTGEAPARWAQWLAYGVASLGATVTWWLGQLARDLLALRWERRATLRDPAG